MLNSVNCEKKSLYIKKKKCMFAHKKSIVCERQTTHIVLTYNK